MRMFKIISLIVMGLMSLGLWAAPVARSAPQLPQAPTATRPAPMTPVPTSTPVAAPAFEGAYIELQVAQGAWTVVQWQDGRGAWHTVEGWQGAADEFGDVRWWVSPAQFGLGPFRWSIYDKPGGTVLTVSQPFDLPQVARQWVVVEVKIQP